MISHDHYDHLGFETVQLLSRLVSFPDAQWVTGLGVGERLSSCGVPERLIIELDWMQSTVVHSKTKRSELTIHALPARHFSGRKPCDRFTTLWSSFVLSSEGHRVYYGADSGPWDGFTEIGEEYGPFDLTMLEIGAFDSAWACLHLGPDGALKAYKQLGGTDRAGLLMHIHWGLFNLALHGWRDPIERLCRLAKSQNVPLWSPRPGTPTEPIHKQVDPWWHN